MFFLPDSNKFLNYQLLLLEDAKFTVNSSNYSLVREQKFPS